jgi:hypothetical protein
VYAREGLTLAFEGVSDDLWILLEKREKDAGWAAGLPSPLLPLPNGSHRHPDRTSELGLAVATIAHLHPGPNGRDVHLIGYVRRGDRLSAHVRVLMIEPRGRLLQELKIRRTTPRVFLREDI